MDNFLIMLGVSLEFVIYILFGVFAQRKGYITQDNISSFIDFVLMILLPCMIFNSFNMDLTVEELKTAAMILTISLLGCAASILLGKVLYRRYNYKKRAIFQYGTIISNAAFVGLPVVEKAFGDVGLFYAAIYLIPLRVFTWSAGVSLFYKTDFKTKFKAVALNPSMVAVYLGLLRMIFHIPVPSILNNALHGTGDAASAMSMILIGAMIASIPLKSVLNKESLHDTLYMSLIRLIAIPLVTLLILKALHVDMTTTAVSVTLLAMPVGSTCSLLAKKYGADHEFGSQVVFVTTLLSLITVPLITLLV